MDELNTLVRAWAVRARVQWSLRWLFIGIAIGLAAAIIPALIARVSPVANQSTLLAIGALCAGAGLVATLAWPWIRARRQTQVAWARRFDAQFQLDERLSTAFELQQGVIKTRDERLRQLQQSDALNAAYQVNINAALPWQLPWRQALTALLALAVLLLAIFLPNPQEQVLAAREEARRVLARQSQSLEVARQIIRDSNLNEAQKQQALQALDEAQARLNDPDTSPEEALAALSDAQARLEALRDEAWQQRREDLRRAGQSMQPSEITNALADALARGNIAQAAEQLSNLTQTPDGRPLDEAQQGQLANQLDQMAREIQNSDPASAQSLREAAQQLRERNTDAAREQLEEVARSLNEATQAAEASRSLDESQAQIDAARQAVARASADGVRRQEQQQAQAQGNQPGSQAAPPQASPANPTSGEQGDQPADGQSPQGQQAGQPGASESNQAAPQLQTSPGHSEDTGTDNSVWAPGPRLSEAGVQVQLPTAGGDSVPNPSGRPNPGVPAGATVPYQQVYREYAHAADEAMQRGAVPPALRDYVRDYFSSLDPATRR